MLDIIWAFLAAGFAALRCLDKERVEVVTSGALLDLVFVLVFVLRISTRCRSCTKELALGILYKNLVVGEWIKDPHWYE